MGISQDTNKPVAWRFPVKVWIGEDRFETRWKATTTPDPDRDGLEPLYTALQPVEQRKPTGWAIELGQGDVTVRNERTQCGQVFYEDRDMLMYAFLTDLYGVKEAT